jgi:hypothetical protein
MMFVIPADLRSNSPSGSGGERKADWVRAMHRRGRSHAALECMAVDRLPHAVRECVDIGQVLLEIGRNKNDVLFCTADPTDKNGTAPGKRVRVQIAASVAATDLRKDVRHGARPSALRPSFRAAQRYAVNSL